MPTGYRMSEHSKFVFSNQYQQNNCALCVAEDDKSAQNSSNVCQHNASVESALHYLRNYGTPLSPSYGYSSYQTQDTTNAMFGGSCSPPVSPNYYTLAEFLLRMNRMRQESGGSGHFTRQYASSRPPKFKSDNMGCLRECAFCKSNGETAEFYKSHFLKDPVGRVRCPILQRYDNRSITCKSNFKSN